MALTQQVAQAHNSVLGSRSNIVADIDAKIALHEHSISSYEEALRDLQAQVHTLRSHRNHAQAISRLPHEILGYIFELTVDGYAEVLTISSHVTHYEPVVFESGWQPWFSIASVSRIWHEVALRTPRFWSFVPLRLGTENLEKTRLFFERSYETPIEVVDFRFKNNLSESMLQLVRENVHRISILQISELSGLLAPMKYIHREGCRVRESDCIRLNAPLLEDLYINGRHLSRLNNTIVRHRCAISLPRLRRLQYNVGPEKHLHAISCPQLTSLAVHTLTDPWNTDAWLSFLNTMPLLETLSIRNAFDVTERPEHFSPITTTALLPRLQSVVMGGHEGTAAVHLLCHIEIPSACSVEILGFYSLSNDELRFIISNLADKARGRGTIGTPQPAAAMILEGNICHGPSRIRVFPYSITDRYLSHSQTHPGDMLDLRRPPLMITLNCESEPMLATLVSLYPMANLRQLRLISMGISTTERKVWEDLSHLSCLWELALSHRHVQVLSPTLIDVLQEHGSFPALERLAIDNYSLSYYEYDVRDKRGVSTMPQLLDALEARLRAGRQIGVLYFGRFYDFSKPGKGKQIEDEDIRRLRNSVDELNVNGEYSIPSWIFDDEPGDDGVERA